MSDFERKGSRTLSRRALLAVAASCGVGAALAPSAAVASPKVSQACVGFLDAPRGDRRCGNCRLFRAPASCLDVAGTISQDCSCRIWLPKIA